MNRTAPTSRRALLAAALGGAGAWVASAAGRVVPAAAANGDAVTIGSNLSGASTTKISTPTAGFAAFWGHSTSSSAAGAGVRGDANGEGYGVYGRAPDGIGVHGSSTIRPGVHGVSSSSYGVYGKSTSRTGVVGESTHEIGVLGVSNYIGVAATSDAGVGLVAESNSMEAAKATTDSLTRPAISAHNRQNQAGLLAYSGAGDLPASPARTGVAGVAIHDATSVGVLGRSTAGRGVRGEATTGVGVQAVATSGVALAVSGRATFSRSGRASVAAKASWVDVVVPGGLSSATSVIATLQIKRGSVHVVAARPNYPSAGKVRIYLSGVASTTVATPVAWFVLG